MIISIALAVALAADPPKKDTVKDLLRDAVTAPTTSEDGGTAVLVNGMDISKMPFTPDTVKKIVLSFQPQIQTCYEETLAAKNKAVEGSLKTSFVITGGGYVKGAAVNKKTSSLKDPRLHDCVVAVLSTMAFPAPPDAKDHPIDFPFNLKAVR